jgi:hypothetical protein
MKRAVLPQPRRRAKPPASGVQTLDNPAGKLVEVVRGALTGARGVVAGTREKGRWLVKLDGATAGILLSIPSSGLRLLPASG